MDDEKINEEELNDGENLEESSDSQMKNSRRKFGQLEFEQSGGKRDYYKNQSLAHKQRIDKAREELQKKEKTYKDKDGNEKLKNKNLLDRFNDKRNLSKARSAALSNKISGLKSKAYTMRHPVDALKIKILNYVKYKLLIGLGIVIAVIIIIAAFVALFTDSGGSKVARGRVYNAECSSITVVESNTGNNGTYDIEEYVAGVVFAEVGGFNNMGVFEATAIAARTFVLRNHSNCTIAGNSTKQAFKPTTDENIIQAVKNTNGYVLMKDGELILTQYDALAIIGESGSDYIISQQNQRIPKSWVHEHISDASLEYYKNHYHGNGMSQWGAYYLATEKGYNGEQILSYYYGNDVEFVSIFASGNYENYTVATSTGGADQLTMSLEKFLNQNGDSVESFNDEMMESVISAGPGTRYGVVAAVSSVVGKLWEEYQIRLPYTYCGAHYCNITSGGVNVNKTGGTYYGVDPDWGSYIGNFYFSGYGPYSYYGPDCSGFIAWALYNGGFGNTIGGADTQGTWGPKYRVGGSYVGQPGDLVWRSGHIMMIIGVDTENKLYYIAHASGGTNGVKIDKVNYTSPGSYFGSSYIVDMTGFYQRNAIVNSAEEYEQRFLNGMKI